jgi:hypothetical protein
MNTIRQCCTCKKKKPLSEFVINRTKRKNGKPFFPGSRSYQCILCNRKYCSAYYRRPGRRQKQAAYGKKYAARLDVRYKNARYDAKRRNIPFEISYDDYIEAINGSVCFYCKQPLSMYGSALDRINNNKGYIKENIVPCCGSCNRIRCDKLTSEEMVVAMNAVMRYRNEKK